MGSPTVREPRVLIFIHSLHGGGAERVAADLSAHWVQSGWQVMLVTQADARDDAYTLHPNVQRKILYTAGEGGGLRGIWANVRRVRALRQVLREFKPDIVLGMMTTASVLAVMAARGSLTKPLSDGDIEAKLRDCSGRGGTAWNATTLVEDVWRLDNLDDASRLMTAHHATGNTDSLSIRATRDKNEV